jgi:hypothetical protein
MDEGCHRTGETSFFLHVWDACEEVLEMLRRGNIEHFLIFEEFCNDIIVRDMLVFCVHAIEVNGKISYHHNADVELAQKQKNGEGGGIAAILGGE